MGYNEEQIANLMNEGIPEASIDLAVDMLNKEKNYKNPLKQWNTSSKI